MKRWVNDKQVIFESAQGTATKENWTVRDYIQLNVVRSSNDLLYVFVLMGL